MSRKNELQPSVRARNDDEEEEEDFVINGSENEGLSVADGTDSSLPSIYGSTASEENDASSAESAEEKDPSSPLKDVSFGALARAQQSFAPPPRTGKRRRSVEAGASSFKLTSKEEEEEEEEEEGRPSKSHKQSHTAQPLRSSKHAPQTLSTRHAVPRKRTIFSPPAALKSRDPRFDPTITAKTTTTSSYGTSGSRSLESDKANQNYSFLTTYRQSELQALQSQVKALENPLHTKNKKRGPAGAAASAPPTDPAQIADLKRQIQSLTSKLATSSTKTREREILRAHKQKERAALREGRKQKPYHLKRGAARKEVEREQVEAMGMKAREKRDVRRRKREKGKEGRGLPRVRRTTTTTKVERSRA